MNAIVKTMFRAQEYRRAERLAKICDYNRSKDDPAVYLNDSMCVGDCKYPVQQKQEALDLLDLLESGEKDQVYDYYVGKLLADYSKRADE